MRTAGSGLLRRWEQRDERYAIRRHGAMSAPLSEREVDAIRANRLWEAERLVSAEERVMARNVAHDWFPPLVRGSR